MKRFITTASHFWGATTCPVVLSEAFGFRGMRCFELCMKINTFFPEVVRKAVSGVPMLAHLRNRSGRRTYRGFAGIGWGGEHAYLDARFQFLVRLGNLLGQHLLADDVRNAHNDFIRHQQPETTKPAQGGLSEFFVDSPRLKTHPDCKIQASIELDAYVVVYKGFIAE